MTQLITVPPKISPFDKAYAGAELGPAHQMLGCSFITKIYRLKRSGSHLISSANWQALFCGAADLRSQFGAFLVKQLHITDTDLLRSSSCCLNSFE